MNSQNRKFKTQYNLVDLAKLICSFLVVTIHVHVLGSAPARSIRSIINFCISNYLARIAVPLLFCFAGFFLYRKTKNKSDIIFHTKVYVRRLLQLYLTWSIIYLPFSIAKVVEHPGGVLQGILLYMRDFFLVGSYIHLWFFPALIFSVVVVSFLLFRGIKPKNILVIASLLYLVGLLFQSWYGLIEPIENHIPRLWNAVQMVLDVIVTTRNGLFDGFLFVSIGMLFARETVKVKKNYAIFGFCCSMILLLIEAFTLQYIHFIKENDMYLFIVPSVFFVFSLTVELEIKGNDKKYKTMRILSSLIYYLHPLALSFATYLLRILYSPLNDTCVRFVLTILGTLILSGAILGLSRTEKTKWLRMLY